MTNTEIETSTAELGDYKLAGQPTSIDELEWNTDEDIVEEFETIERFECSVTINGRDTAFLVGRSPQTNYKVYRLHHHPKTGRGIAGVIQYENEYNHDGPDNEIVAFIPSGDSPDDVTVVEAVTDIEVATHDRTERLDGLFDHIRTELTESDWTTDGITDTGYGEWLDATHTVRRFIDDSEEGYLLPAKTVLQPKIMHAIARYPLASEAFLAQTSDAIRDNVDGGFHTANPEALRSILLDYAEQNGINQN